MKNNTTPQQLGEMLSIARSYKLSSSALFSLCVLAEMHSATIGQLTRELGLSTAAATGVADSLADKEFITRTNGRTDRRTIWLEITPRGREALNDILHPQAVAA